MPLISVIVPCYNQAQYLDECLQSVLDQTYQDWECIIVNDGSPDNTEEVAKKWLAKDSRFKYLYKDNGGLSSARNAGIKESKGEYIQLLDCDDYISSDKFEIQLVDLQDHDISISDYAKVNDIHQVLSKIYCTPFSQGGFNFEDLILKWEKELSIPCHCVLFRKADIFFNERLKNHEDWVFWVQLFYYSKKIKYQHKVMAFYRIAPTSMSRNYAEMNIGFIKACQFLQNYFSIKSEKRLAALAAEKKRSLSLSNNGSLKEKIAAKFPKFYKLYIKNVSK